jgi:hypothetical protein
MHNVSTLASSSTTFTSNRLLTPARFLKQRFGPDRLIVPDPSPESFAPIAAPVPTSGGDLPKLPSEGAGALSPVGYSYDPLRPVSGPAPSEAPLPEAGGAVPFISSNPAVPLPTGVTDTATILPLPSPGGNHALVYAPFSFSLSLSLFLISMF